MPPLLLDISAVPECHCNECLEGMYKSIAQDPGGDGSIIWEPHPDPLTNVLVGEMTGRFQRALEAIQDALARLLIGEPIGILQKSDAPWMRWDESRFQEVRAHLESKSPAHYTLDDWLAVIDVLINQYLPDGVIQSDADYMAVRAALIAKVEANMQTGGGKPNRPEIEAVVLMDPMDFGRLPEKILTPVEWSVIHVAKARAAENISNLTQEARHKCRSIIIEHVQAQMLGMKQGRHEYLRSRLFDSFGQLNRDFRRIAVTEAGDAILQGYIGAQKPGTKVRRQEAYRGACPYCKSISGKVFTVVDPADPKKNGDTDVWVGKDNIGRSASPRMRQGGALVERPSSERWWVAAGVIHPHCRGSWTPVTEKPPEVSQEFADWLDGMIANAQGKAPS